MSYNDESIFDKILGSAFEITLVIVTFLLFSAFTYGIMVAVEMIMGWR